jgi:DNA-binding response OmpR family regulator
MAEEGLLKGNLVCMLTAQTEPMEKSHGLEEYVLDYVTKPFNASVLLKAINHGLSLLST